MRWRNTAKCFKIGESVFVGAYKKRELRWEDGVVTKHVGKILYLVKGTKELYNRHIKQEKKNSLRANLKECENQ